MMGRARKQGSLFGSGSLWYNLTSYGLGSTEPPHSRSKSWVSLAILFLNVPPPSARLHLLRLHSLSKQYIVLGDQVFKYMVLLQVISPLNHNKLEFCY